MSISGQPKNVLIIYNKSVDVYFTKNRQPIRFLLTPDIVNQQEIISQSRFENLLLDFFNKNGLSKSTFLIIMSEEVVYHKSIPNDQKNIQAQANIFFSELPFNPQAVARLIYLVGANAVLVGTNNQLYITVKSAVEKLKGKVMAVVPSILFPEVQNGAPLTAVAVSAIFAKIKIIKAGDFLTAQNPDPGTFSNEKEINNSAELTNPDDKSSISKRKFVITAAVLLVASALIVLIYIVFTLVFHKNPN